MKTRSERASSHLDSAARALGWFSLAFGVVEVLAPRSAAKLAGVERRDSLVRAYGARELACGVGLLSSKNPAPFLLARTGGDMLDLLTVAVAHDRRRRRSRALLTGIGLAGIAAVDAYAAVRALKRTDSERNSGHTRTSRDYTTRSGFPRPPSEMTGAALSAARGQAVVRG